MANNNHFELTLDTLAPVGGISRGANRYANAQFALTVTKGDATFMSVWYSTDSVKTYAVGTAYSVGDVLAYKDPADTSNSQYAFYTVKTAITAAENTAFSAISSKLEANATEVMGAWEAAADSKQTAFAANGHFYYHAVLMDDVGNESVVYNTEIITYDTVAPVVTPVIIHTRNIYQTNKAYSKGDIFFDKDPSNLLEFDVLADVSAADNTSIDALLNANKIAIRALDMTTTREVAITFGFTDADPASGCVSCAISGDINAESTAWVSALTADEIAAGYATRNIVLSGTGEEEATKTVSITVTDAAGNVATAVSDSIYLDTKFLTGNIVVRDSADSKTINDTWVNVQDVKVKLQLAEGTSDVVSYKLWGDINAAGGSTPTTEPTEFTPVTKGTNPIVVDTKMTSGDSASKTFYAKVKDESGNVTTLTSVIVKYDATAPTVSIAIKTGETKYVSKVAGFTTKDLVPTFDASISGSAAYVWKMDGTAFSGGTGTGDPTEFQIDSKDMGEVEGDHAFTLTITDAAGNSATSEAVQVYLDQTPPECSGLEMALWYNGDAAETDTYSHWSVATVPSSASDAGAGIVGVGKLVCWVSQTAEDTTVVGDEIVYETPIAHAHINGTIAQSASNYMHVKYIDAVGNAKIYHSAAFGIDTVVPADGTVGFDYAVFNTTTATLTLGYSDATSGVAFYKLWGDITEASAEPDTWSTIVGAKTVTLTTGDGNKTVYAKYKDTAGNVSANTTSTPGTGKFNPTELDTTAPSAQVNLLDKDAAHGTTKTSPTCVAEFKTEIEDLEGISDIKKYKIYGDFTFSAQSSSGTAKPTEWTDFTYDSGKTYMTLTDMFCTTGSGVKNVYVYVMDNAGNVFPHKEGQPTVEADSGTKAFFTYDVTPPEVQQLDKDYSRVSVVHTLRRTASGETAGKYNDEVKMTFTPNEVIQAYKICAYADMTAAKAGTHADDPIGTTYGSTNMSASGIKSDAQVSSMIKGADYRTALGGSESTSVDGAHIVVVYVQDEGGTWSASVVEV